MAESPDYQPIDFAPFPGDPSQYISIQDGGNATTASAFPIASLTDSKLYVIKAWVARGASVNQSTTNMSVPTALMQVSRGLNNAGVAADIDYWQGRLPISTASNTGDPISWVLESPTPLVVRAGTVGTPNNLYITLAADSGSFFTSFGTALLMWPLN